MSYSTIGLEVDGNGVAVLTLTRPDKLNAFTREMAAEIRDAFDRTDGDDAVKVVIVTGAGRAFCAGADLSEGGARFDHGDYGDTPPRDGGGITTLRIFDSLKPVIAAINGPAVGVGTTLTLPMDVRIASDQARFAVPFTRRGVVPESCSSWFLPRVVGVSRALEWFYSGRMFDAGEALEAGLVSAVCAPEDLLPAAREIAARFIDGTAPVSVTLTRQLVWRMLGADHPMTAHIAESRGMAARGGDRDAYEGITSFLEKRDPVFGSRVSSELPDIFPGRTEPQYR
ncbi:crotonase/enoyl-CoA hydratase family protein [Tsukamurella ocularis]|uniref:crotonase/enoyl-CoA hydratase family protein n=1 Tax=Tsukamurella ocularis TaxID=1970234 RepID=UPI0039EEC3BD